MVYIPGCEYCVGPGSLSETNLMGCGVRTASDIKSGDHSSLEGDITPTAVNRV